MKLCQSHVKCYVIMIAINIITIASTILYLKWMGFAFITKPFSSRDVIFFKRWVTMYNELNIVKMRHG